MKTITLAILLCLSQTACIKHAVLTPAQNFRLTSTMSIAVISAVDLQAARLAVDLNAKKVISDDLARAIFAYTDPIAKAVRPAITIQSGSSSDQEKADAVIAILRQAKLPSEVSSFVKSPNASPEVAGLIALLSATITGVQIITGGK